MIDANRWQLRPVFALLQEGGRIAPEEMARTFNCGIGMAVIVAGEDAAPVAAARKAQVKRCSTSAVSKKGLAAAP